MLRDTLNYIVANKEWIFSGLGVAILLGLISLLKGLFGPRKKVPSEAREGVAPSTRPAIGPQPKSGPSNWHGIMPEGSKYTIVSEMRDYVQLGPQTYTFEYGPTGHAKVLRFSDGSFGQLVIMYTCEIKNPYLAMYGAGGDFALNVLPPKFLVGAREILETTTPAAIRKNRQEVSSKIRAKMAPEFEAVGVTLISVSIDSIDKLERVATKRAPH
jgi:hypothetical protein